MIHQRTERLWALMEKHDLTCVAVAKITSRKPQTVRTWRCSRPVIPQERLDLLEDWARQHLKRRAARER
jgi:hypothetical protein